MTTMLLEWVFTSIFLILAVLALRAVFGGRVGARLRYALWAVVLVRLLVPVQLFTSPLAGTWVFTGKRVEQSAADWPSAPVHAGDNAALDLGGQAGPSAALSDFPQAPDAPAFPDAPEPPAAPDLTKAPAWLGWAWLAGSAAAVLVLLLSNLRFSRRLRRRRVPMEGADCPLPVYAAVGLPSPCLFGVIRPAVYVTPEAAADPTMLRHVLAHEYTHFLHGDHLWSVLRCAALAAHWWNPLVWLAVRLSRRDGELACDEGALERLGDGERLAYGNTLLALVTARPGPGELLCFATTMAGDKKSLRERVSRIARAPKRWLWAALAVVLATALACVCAFGQAAEPEDGPEPDPMPVQTTAPDMEEAPVLGVEPQTDLDRDGVPETLRASGQTEGMNVEIWEDGRLLWSDVGGNAHAGYNAVFLCTLDGEDYLLRYHPYMQQGWCDYSYELFTLSESGEEQTVRENSLEFSINLASPMVFGGPYGGSFDAEKIAAFMDEINGLLANSVQLINTDVDLLGTFQDAGRLVDDLWWLDIWEPAFIRDPSKSLLENLRNFQTAMEMEAGAVPKVEKTDVEGEYLLTYRGMEKRFNSAWEPFYPDDTVDGQVIDLNGDDNREIVFSLQTAHGTGCLWEELHVFDAATLEEYDCSGVVDMILSQVSSRAGEDRFYVSAPGLEAEIEKQDIDYNYQDSVGFGDYYRFQVENGRLYGCFAAALDRSNLCYCGALKVELRLDNGRLVCAGFEYKTDLDF